MDLMTVNKPDPRALQGAKLIGGRHRKSFEEEPPLMLPREFRRELTGFPNGVAWGSRAHTNPPVSLTKNILWLLCNANILRCNYSML